MAATMLGEGAPPADVGLLVARAVELAGRPADLERGIRELREQAGRNADLLGAAHDFLLEALIAGQIPPRAKIAAFLLRVAAMQASMGLADGGDVT